MGLHKKRAEVFQAALVSTMNFHIVKSPAFFWFSNFLPSVRLGIPVVRIRAATARKENAFRASAHF